MTNEERAALVKWFRTGAEEAREEGGRRLGVGLDTAANQIEADGKRIAELEIEAQAQYHRGYYDARVAALGDKPHD